VTTTDVTALTAASVTNDAITITGDANLAAVTVTAGSGENDSVSVGLGNANAVVTVDLGAGDADSLGVTASGAVTVAATAVESLELTGNGAALSATVTGLAAPDLAVSGDQSVTITGASTVFDNAELTDTSTAGTTSVVATGGNINAEGLGVLSGTLDVSDGAVNAVTLLSGNTVDVGSNASLTLTVGGNDSAADEITINADGATAGPIAAGFETINITGNDAGTTGVYLTVSATNGNDASINWVSSENDIALELYGVSVGGSFSVNVASTGAVDIGSTLLWANFDTGDGVDYTVNGGGAITGGLPTFTSNDAAMDIEINSLANDVTLTSVSMTDYGAGDPAGNDVASSLVVSADGAAAVTTLSLDAANDSLVSITGGTTVTVGSVINDGGNQSVDITLTATANDVTSGALTAAGGDILVDAGGAILGGVDMATTGTGTITLGAGGAIAAGAVFTAEGALDVAGLGAVTLTSAISTDGNVDVSGDSISATTISSDNDGTVTLLATNDISVTNATSNDGDLSITAGGDVTATSVSTAGSGNVEVEAASLAATFVESTGGDVTLTLSSADATVTNLTGSTVTIAADGNDVTVANITTADAVIVSGSADVDLGDADVTVINAEIATGDITANITNAGASAEAVITTNTGNDTLTLNDNAVAFTVNAGDGDNVITLTNTATATGVTTGSGNDTINLNDTNAAEVTQVTTGAGDDIVNVAATAGANDIANTGEGDDAVNLAGTAAGFTANTGDDNDTITFAVGIPMNDVTINAGDGSDTVVLTNSAYTNITFDSIEVVNISGAGVGVATLDAASFASDNTFMLSGDGNDITIVADATGGVIDASGVTFDTGNESILFTLSADDDIVTGTSLDDSLVGLAGDDELIGGDGNDTLTGGDGNDTLTGGDGNDTITGGDGNDTITGGDGNDTITGGDGNDIIDTGAGGGAVTGGDGADTITLGSGDDTVVFAAGTESSNDAFDTITGFTSGNDSLDLTTTTGNAVIEIVLDSDQNDFAAVEALAGAAYASGQDVYVSVDAFGSGDTYVFVDADDSNDISAGDYVIVLAGIDSRDDIAEIDFAIS
ncbi:DUF4097 family beta strand repeat-containing protein, partial [Luminiphilus sp.]|nr:DUF4097 family beta strand repeat-containing protein [Luminiphilus sp.]